MISKLEWTYQGTLAAAGLLTIGYLAGKYQSSAVKKDLSKKKVAKSYESDADPINTYCVQHSTPLSDVQEKLMKETLKHEMGQMLGAPEVISLNAALIHALGAKKVCKFCYLNTNLFFLQ